LPGFPCSSSVVASIDIANNRASNGADMSWNGIEEKQTSKLPVEISKCLY